MLNLTLIAIFGIDMLLSARLAYFEGVEGRAVLLAEARFQPKIQTGSVAVFGCVMVLFKGEAPACDKKGGMLRRVQHVP